MGKELPERVIEKKSRFSLHGSGTPRIALLGGPLYSTLVSTAGGGISRHGDIAINRWRVDPALDGYGQWCYLRDVGSGRVWSATVQPVGVEPESYKTTFRDDRVTFERRDGDFETRTEVVIPVEVTAEARRVTVANNSSEGATIELTSYQEVVLAPIISDRGHRAFSNLFVQTEWLAESNSILAMRRPRSAVVRPLWCGHTIALDENAGSISCETDRSVFVGRGRSQRNPVAMDNPGDLPGTLGAVLDPVFALRTTLSIPAGGSAAVIFSTFYANDRDDAMRLAHEFSNSAKAASYFYSAAENGDAQPADAWSDDTAVHQKLASLLLFRARSYPTGVIGSAVKSDRRDLISIGITGELPVLLARIGTSQSSGRIAEMIELHRYWSSKGIECDFVIITHEPGDNRDLKREIATLVTPGGEIDSAKRPGGVFLFDVSELSERQAHALNDVARIQIDCDLQALAEVADG